MPTIMLFFYYFIFLKMSSIITALMKQIFLAWQHTHTAILAFFRKVKLFAVNVVKNILLV